MKWYLLDTASMDAATYYKWYACLGAQKKRRVDGFRFESDRLCSVAGEMLARKALSRQWGVDAEAIVFSADLHGKPYAVGLDAHFNISHSGQLVLCGADTHPVGVDIERIRPIRESLLHRVCTPEERAKIWQDVPAHSGQITDPQVLRRFFAVWTAKEAYLKYLGTGISRKLSDLSVPPGLLFTSCVEGYVFSICCHDPGSIPPHPEQL